MEKPFIRLRRLGWAGVEIEYNNQTLLIDYIRNTSPLVPLRSAEEPFPQSSRPGAAAGALLTHLHADHADPGALSLALHTDAPVFRPAAATGEGADLELTLHAESQFTNYPLATEVVGDWKEGNIGPFRVFSVPAVDGFGDRQISWVVEVGNHRIFHAGDTLFHGYWWRIANRFGPIDLAFLPINGAVVEFPSLQPASPLEAVMNPEEAAVAARILQAKLVVPIHYQSLHKPPIYVETPNATQRLSERLNIFGIRVMRAEPGEWFELD